MLLNKSRSIVIFILAIIFSMIVIFRLTSLTFVGLFKENTEHSIIGPVLRGMIFDRNGIIMAGSRLVYSVTANPQELNRLDSIELKGQVDKISTILAMERASIVNILLRGSSKKFVWLKRKVDYKTYLAIKSLDMKGIYFREEYKRVYPHNGVASHLLGFAGIDDIGLEGMELAYDTILKPKNSGKKVVYGRHLYLTIDSNIQKVAEGVLNGGIQKYSAEEGTILVIDSSNGEILSLANYPSYDNNKFQLYHKNSYKNIAITDHYEPGSTFKMFTAAMLLDRKKLTTRELFYCPGSIAIGGRVIKCSYKHGYVNIRDILKKSCNVGIITASARVPKGIFYHYLREFGFGKVTGLGLVGENAGLLRHYNEITALSQAMVSFGYEVAVTPLQLVLASSVIANGGILYKPLIVKKVVDRDNKIFSKSSSVIKRRVISKEAANLLMLMLESVLEPGGTGVQGSIKGISIAGKTGTANIYNPKSGTYDLDSVNTTFIGFVPVYNKVLTILVMIRRPKVGKVASYVAVPIFRELVLKLLAKGYLY